MKQEKIYQDLILQIIELYQSARKVSFFDKRISRGISRSVFSIIEDLFAKFLVENIKCDHIFIDQPITIEGLKNNRHPDLCTKSFNLIKKNKKIKYPKGYISVKNVVNTKVR